MPLYYDNTSSLLYSQTERAWTEPQDWTIKGVTGLILQVHGNPRKSVKTSESSFSLSGAGADMKAVKKLFIGVGDRKKPQAGGAGLIYIDDIGLTRPAPVDPNNAGTP